jgi:SAM-dependent methyltransferase
MTSRADIFDRDLLRRRRDRFAAVAAENDFLLRHAADDLAERLRLVRRTFAVGACIGAYHGVLSRRLRAEPGSGILIDLEASAGLLRQCDGPRLKCDEELLPFAPETLDLVVSALSLHHVNDLPGLLIQVRRVLKPDGLFLASLLAGDSLCELREAFIAAEAETVSGASPRVAPFADVRALGGLLQRAGFALPVADAERVTVAYASPLALMQELRRMGAANALCNRRRQPLRRATLRRAAEIYAERFSRSDGRVAATFEIVTLIGWAPHESQQRPLQPGSARMRLADALGVPERSLGDKPAS